MDNFKQSFLGEYGSLEVNVTLNGVEVYRQIRYHRYESMRFSHEDFMKIQTIYQSYFFYIQNKLKETTANKEAENEKD